MAVFAVEVQVREVGGGCRGRGSRQVIKVLKAKGQEWGP